jgi:hypothetical protein
MQPQLANLLAMVPKAKRPRFVRLLLQNTTGVIFGRAADKPILQTVAETVWMCLEEPDTFPAQYTLPQ